MRTNGGAHIVDEEAVHAKARLYQVSHQFRRRQIITVADENNIVLVTVGSHLLLHVIHQCMQRFLTSSYLTDDNQMSIVIYMKLGFDTGQCSYKCRSLADTSAAVEVIQIIHGKYMYQMQTIILHPLCHFFHGFALISQSHCLVDQQSLSQRSAQTVDHDDLAIGLFLHDLIRRDPHAVVSTAQSGGESDTEDLFIFFQIFRKMSLCLLRVDLGCSRHLALSHQCIEFFFGKFLSLSVSHTIHDIAKVHASKIMFLQILYRQISSTVCNDFKHWLPS